ncbi:MAG TPA: TrkA family potassium uptake protein [Dehalococcoidia bacterium]|nr:TrkA family potassium uptake protein [Dehalococcoidia bacterium]
MYVIIVGDNEVGYSLCKELLNAGHEVLIIEKDATKCENLEKELGSVSLCGNGSEMAILTKAGTARADIFIAVTGEDEDNLAACQIAKQKFDVHRIVARINNPKNEHIFAKLGIDHTVDVVALVLEHIKAQASISSLIHLLNFKEQGGELVLVKVGDPAAGKSLTKLPLPPGSIVSLLIRQGQQCQVPTPDTVLKLDDQLICLIPSGSKESVQAIFAG